MDNFANAEGQPTNAVYGFVSMLANLLVQEQPTHIAVAFDLGRTTFRTARYSEYKATRSESPQEFRGQIGLIRRVLEAMRIPTLDKPDFEADDILATLAARGRDAGMQVLVCSGDRDAFQLVTDTVTVLYPVRGVSELNRMDPQAVFNRYGVDPQHYPDLAALVGEQSDNLPGVPGVGPKTAAKWIAAYGDLETILGQAAQIKGKVGESLREHVAQVALNRELNRLVDTLELPLAVEDLAVAPWNRHDLHEILVELEFRSLRERLWAMLPDEEPEAAVSAGIDLTVAGPGELGPWLAARTALVGVEVSGNRRAFGADAWQVTVADDAGAVLSVDLTALDPADERTLSHWLASSAPKAVHRAKEAEHALAGRGDRLEGVVFDTELAAYLCNPDRRGYDVNDLAVTYLRRQLDAGAPESAQGLLDLDFEDHGQERRTGERTQAVLELVGVLQEELRNREAESLLLDVELPLQRILTQMEQTGIAADVPHLEQLELSFDAQVRQAAHDAYAVIGREVNLGSPKQLQEVLFDELKMPHTKKIKTGYTTDAAALADLHVRTGHPFLTSLLAHRDAIRLRQTVEGLRRAVQDDGRVHTTFQQTVAATGRLSSVDPNLQNIPIRTEEGRRIRQAFVVGDGFEQLLTADYSQIEMRIMAHLSGDEGLIEAFHLGEDLHSYVAARVFGCAPAEVDQEMRSKVKAMSYGLAYGLSSYGLSQQLAISVGEATALRDDYFARFGAVRDYLQTVVVQARRDGYTQTLLGRRRYLPDLNSDNRMRRESAERMALNAPIQGTAADLVKLSMIGVDARLRQAQLGSRMLLQVHDELVLEVAPGEVEQVEQLVRQEMAAVGERCGEGPLRVPLDVSVGRGLSWHDAGH